MKYLISAVFTLLTGCVVLDVDVAHIGQTPDCKNIRIQVELVGFGLYESTQVSCAEEEEVDALKLDIEDEPQDEDSIDGGDNRPDDEAYLTLNADGELVPIELYDDE